MGLSVFFLIVKHEIPEITGLLLYSAGIGNNEIRFILVKENHYTLTAGKLLNLK